jgi:hypothetical protein
MSSRQAKIASTLNERFSLRLLIAPAVAEPTAECPSTRAKEVSGHSSPEPCCAINIARCIERHRPAWIAFVRLARPAAEVMQVGIEPVAIRGCKFEGAAKIVCAFSIAARAHQKQDGSQKSCRCHRGIHAGYCVMTLLEEHRDCLLGESFRWSGWAGINPDFSFSTFSKTTANPVSRISARPPPRSR